jgi:hypothetical protein
LGTRGSRRKVLPLLLRIEKIKGSINITKKALSKDQYDTTIEIHKDIYDNRMGRTIALLKNLPRDDKEDSQT